MKGKMTLEEFRRRKQEMQTIIEDASAYVEEHFYDEAFDENEYSLIVLEKIYVLQDELLSFDLSEIPFEEWENFDLYSQEDHPVDFSQTKANINFAIIPHIDYANFTSCNVQNIQYVATDLNNYVFDQETKEKNPGSFLQEELFDSNFVQKFYQNELDFHDLVNLTDEEMTALSSVDFVSHMKDYSLITFDFSFEETGGLSFGELLEGVINRYGSLELLRAIKRHEDFFLIHLSQTDSDSLIHFMYGLQHNTTLPDMESCLFRTVKRYISEEIPLSSLPTDGYSVYGVPEWLESFDCNIVYQIKTGDELLQATNRTIVLDKQQSLALDTFGIENLKQLEQKTGIIFAGLRGTGITQEESLNVLARFFSLNHPDSLILKGIDFQRGTLPYPEFEAMFVKLLDVIRVDESFIFPNYDWIEGEFREKYPQIFMSKDAPPELKRLFFTNGINISTLAKHPEYIPFLVDKDLTKTIKSSIELKYTDSEFDLTFNFIDEYCSNFGNKKLLDIIDRYGPYIDYLTVECESKEMLDAETAEKAIRRSIYKKIKTDINFSYSGIYLTVPEFRDEYPELFVNFYSISSLTDDQAFNLQTAFYNRSLTFQDIRLYPELYSYLINKDLHVAFGHCDQRETYKRIKAANPSYHSPEITYSDLDLLDAYGNANFLQLCIKYGRCLKDISKYISNRVFFQDGKYYDLNQFKNGVLVEISFDQMVSIIEKEIEIESLLGNIQYQPEDAPLFLKRTRPELFIDENAPTELQLFFYNQNNNYPMTLSMLKKHKEWMPYLEGKDIYASLLRNNYYHTGLLEFRRLFGDEKSLKLGISRAETVEKMIAEKKVPLMKQWYDKTGGKFIPDYVVMANIPLEEADRFLSSAANWSRLMRIPNFAEEIGSREVMLKLAYAFGTFDHDTRGFKNLMTLLTELPRNIPEQSATVITQMDNVLNSPDSLPKLLKYYKDSHPDYSGENQPTEEIIDYFLQSIEQGDLLTTKNYHRKLIVSLLNAIKEEHFPIDFSSSSFMEQIYRKHEDGSYSLRINTQQYPKTSYVLRTMMEAYTEAPILSPDKAKRFFKNFNMNYDPDFRIFFLRFQEEILTNESYLKHIAEVQRRFGEIKATYLNLPLTPELVFSYVLENRYENVNTGNKRVSKVAAMQNYSQKDFETLQQIYNHAKQRTYSSIPRVTGVSGKYSYEMLRLDDPLAMAIGFLTDCCQTLHDEAEVCMEHSMTDRQGRLFVIRDKDNPNIIIAQSWVWRDRGVICFDNIEVPDTQMILHGIPKDRVDEGIRNEFTDEVLAIYQMVARQLMEEDEKVFRQLLESGAITQEQYERMRLKKVTVGWGWSNIKGSFALLKKDDKIVSPPDFEPPIPLVKKYYTSDSRTQFILEEREGETNFEGETITPFADDYIVCDDSNFPPVLLDTFDSLEIESKEFPNHVALVVRRSNNPEKAVSALANFYGLHPDATHIIMNSNFGIIYEETQDKIIIGDLVYNTTVDNGNQQFDITPQVLVQIRLALDQIRNGKEFDISQLEPAQKEMFEKAMALSEELDIERGVGHEK